VSRPPQTGWSYIHTHENRHVTIRRPQDARKLLSRGGGCQTGGDRDFVASEECPIESSGCPSAIWLENAGDRSVLTASHFPHSNTLRGPGAVKNPILQD
jgi:hypothetical protein